jgi:hypothetical protein
MQLGSPFALPDDDLEAIAPVLRFLVGQRLPIAGDADFAGRWLLASPMQANRHHGAGLHAAARSLRQFPALTVAPKLDWCRGDVCDFQTPASLAPADLPHARRCGLHGERPLDEPLRRTLAWLQQTNAAGTAGVVP